MSLEKAKADLDKKGFLDHVIELADSTATVAEAAEALGVEPGMIAKTMSFLQGDAPVLILTEGTAKIDNHKYKETFHVKAKMIPFDEVEEKIGHAPGGVCPFGINDGIAGVSGRELKAVYDRLPGSRKRPQRGKTHDPGAGESRRCERLGGCM